MKTIIFDLGNVVVFFDHHRAVKKLQPFSPLSAEEMFASVYASELEDRIERGQMTPAVFLRDVHRRWQLRCDVDFLAHVVGDVFWTNPEVCDLIPRLSERYRLVLGSNTNAVHAKRFLRQFAPVLKHFQHLVLSHEIGWRKPDNDFYATCHRFAQAPASECVFVDDLSANIDGARAYGFHGIVYQPNAGLADQLQALGVAA